MEQTAFCGKPKKI